MNEDFGLMTEAEKAFVEAHDARIRQGERDRIIALLESTDRLTTIEGGALVNYADEAIALIKGENE